MANPHYSEIIRGKLWLGDLEAAKSITFLRSKRITHIVSVCTEPIPSDDSRSGHITLRIPVEASPFEDLLIHMPAAYTFIDQAIAARGSVTLVHCNDGNNRSAAIVAAYLMRHRREQCTPVLSELHQLRPYVAVDPEFQRQLVLYEVCRYKPSPSEGVYISFKSNLEKVRQQVAEAQRLAAKYGHPSNTSYLAGPSRRQG